jgi:hypothetical protein
MIWTKCGQVAAHKRLNVKKNTGLLRFVPDNYPDKTRTNPDKTTGQTNSPPIRGGVCPVVRLSVLSIAHHCFWIAS